MSDYIQNFPFPIPRPQQVGILNEIEMAFKSGYKHIVLEAPTGIGKSPIAIAVARTLGTSYICTSTKDLQSQYARDFRFLRVAEGKNNFICTVKEDFIKNGTFKCGLCSTTPRAKQCHHMNADCGPCNYDDSFRCHRFDVNRRGCKYRTLLQHYEVKNKGTIEEEVFIKKDAIDNIYQNEYSGWSYLKNLKEELRIWRPCEYYHQLNMALASSHSVFNYSMFLIYALIIDPNITTPILSPRELLVLDEAHKLEEEVVRLVGISISKKRLKKYIPDFEIVNYGDQNIEGWIEFLQGLYEDLNKLIILGKISKELAAEVDTYNEKLDWTIGKMIESPGNWVVSEINMVGDKVMRVEFKPLDISNYCEPIFHKCDKTLMMSATILDKNAFCRCTGLVSEEVKFIQVPSDFPLQNRPIYPLNIEYLNYKTINEDSVKQRIAAVVDRIMTHHKDHKGIIHTTSYKQLNFIKDNISEDNRQRLIETDPEVERNEVITEHINARKPTVLISPSLHLGIDLKDDLSRFQVITKVPYPSLADKWIDGKRKRNEQWYLWQTALKLVQGYGRSVRSKDDWAITYILDSLFESFVKRNKNILPDWFVDGIKALPAV